MNPLRMLRKRNYFPIFLAFLLLFALFLPLDLIFSLSFASAETNDKKICYWEAEKNGRISLLFGTMHILSGGYLKNLKERIKSSDIIIVEIDDFAESNVKLVQAATFPQHQSLKKSISPEVYNKAVDYFSQKGLTKVVLDRFKPWYLGLMAQLLQSQEFITFKTLPMDLYILKLAQTYKVPTLGLETVEEQISCFEKLSMKAQEAFLEESIDPRTKQEMVTLKNLYLQGKLEEIENFLEETIDAQQSKELYHVIYTERNHRMNAVILPYAEKGNAFIAVGFGHLVTETGVVHFLEKKGFTVTKKSLIW
ncbi:MAG: TraB/GumN family protein [Candidatus Aureabacteria bacterium]|nr:TraB/GumN family protein [Candidatus Auribacterota bacterium]